MKTYDFIVVGGGAAGLIAAITAARRGKTVLILERNARLGKKLLITGKGRCNVTNDADLQGLLGNIPSNSKFLYSAFSQFSSADTIAFFEDLGVPLKTERGNRVFPQSDRAGDIVSALEKAVKALDVTVTTSRVTALVIENQIVAGVEAENARFFGKAILLATGGKSYPLTGSTGDGYALARTAGHDIRPLVPSLVPIVTEESFCSELMGLSLKNVTLRLHDKEKSKPLYSELGEMLFTHFGVSGPLVLSASSHIRSQQQGRFSLEIDLKPGLDEGKLDLRLQRDFGEGLNKDFGNCLNKLLPSKLIPVFVRLSSIPSDTKVNQITKEQRAIILRLLKCFPLTVKCFRPIEEAIITSGGVAVGGVSPKTMESNLVKGLYFAGELLDVDGYTGGFNLQIAFSTGFVAGNNC